MGQATPTAIAVAKAQRQELLLFTHDDADVSEQFVLSDPTEVNPGSSYSKTCLALWPPFRIKCYKATPYEGN